uniref:Ovule protein n=1 Tax=Angiostrongylus cantonensis TaxID=6313 RepID=A0A0K0D4N0_ANGCA
LRFNLDWAVKCEHSYNSRYCINFDEKNVTVRDFHHSPENHWPAQEFNKLVVLFLGTSQIPFKQYSEV